MIKPIANHHTMGLLQTYEPDDGIPPPGSLSVTVSELEDLTRDTLGNAAKQIIREGAVVGAVPELRGETRPPRPPLITCAELDYNMARFGYGMITPGRHIVTKPIRPEYAVAGAVYGFDVRRRTSGLVVVLCKAAINWGLMVYEAVRYGFGGILYGVVRQLEDRGRLDGVGLAARMLESHGCVPTYVEDVDTALRVYRC